MSSDEDLISTENILIENYLDNLVESQPEWIKALFKKRKVAFSLSKDGELGLKFSSKIQAETKERVVKIVHEYLSKQPVSFLEATTLH